MKKVFLSLLLAASTMSISAALWIGGAEINDEVIAKGIVDSLNKRAGVTVTGAITMNAAKDTLTLDNCMIEDANDYSDPGVELAPLCFVDVKNLTIVVKGTNIISSTGNVGHNDALKVRGVDSVLFVGASKKDSLFFTKSGWYTIHMAGEKEGLIQFKNLYLQTREMSQNNSWGPGVVFDNVNAKIFSIDRLNSITFKDCAIVSPAEAKLEYEESHGWSIDKNNLVIKAAPQKGDTIRYEYAGNNLFYKISSKVDGKYEVFGVGGGSAYPAEAPTGNVIFPDSIQDFLGAKYAVTSCGNAVKNCAGVTGVQLNNIIKSLTSYSFSGTSITSFDTKNVEIINYAAFSGVKVTTVHIGPALETLAKQSFLLDSAFTVTIDEANPNLMLVGSMLVSKDGKTLVGMPTKIADVVYRLPKTLELINDDVVTNQKGTLIYPKVIPFEHNNTHPGSWSWMNCPAGDVIVPCGLRTDFTTGDFGKNFTHANSVTEGLTWNVKATCGEGGNVAIADTTSCNLVRITATPSEGYDFGGWSNGSNELTIQLEVVSDTAVVASFIKQTPTAIENQTTNDQRLTTKFIKDGQLFIIRDDKTYNILGAEVE